MPPESVVLDDTSIDERRAELVARAGMSLDQLRRSQEARSLDQGGQAILRRLEDLEFLAGH